VIVTNEKTTEVVAVSIHQGHEAVRSNPAGTETDTTGMKPVRTNGHEAAFCNSEEMIQAMRSGDVQVLDRLTRCFGERLLAVGRSRCRNEEEAQDAVQDALLSAGEHMVSFRGEGSVEGWLVRMVANACSHRRRGRKNDASIHATDVAIPSTEHSPEKRASQSEVAEVIGQALLRLSPKDRALLLLAAGEGFTGPELARRMGLSPTAVRVRLTRIRARLRQDLGPDFDGALAI
jgi:RNA polymerase sigma-70 factor, ECF subfamily